MEDRELYTIAKEFRDGMLGDNNSKAMCFAVCTALAGYLNFAGYECEIEKGMVGDWEHYWLALPGKMILDPTADQFNTPNSGQPMPAIWYGPKPYWYEMESKAK